MRSDRVETRFASVEAFLVWEEGQADRYEYLAGAVWPAGGDATAMAGGSLTHNDLVFNMRTALTAVFRPRGCRVQSETVKLKTDTYAVYPDVMVVCTPCTGRETTVGEATVVVEVLAEGTQTKDRTLKQQSYLDLPFLLQYVLVSQERQLVEVYSRQGDGWAYKVFRGSDPMVDLPAVDARVAMADLYRDTDVPPAAAVVPLRGA
ncbi:Uma2 family endonuclease [Azospirillum sp. ST 5-10]|uniref:Uma2 family endonuclease n=1 Tax=unclassified Azospirillum TaxID=2630922 RepID=UPI003F49BCF5